MINIIAGLPGAGKTAYLSKLVQKFLAEGETIYSYELLKFKNSKVKYFKEISEIRQLKNATIILDEAQIWFNSRYWDKLDPALQYALQQHRHAGIDIWGAVQHINRVDAIMRELVQNYFEIKRVFGTSISRKKGKTVFPKRPFQISTIRQCDVMRANNITRKVGAGLPWPVLFTKKDFDFFDTLADYSSANPNEKFSIEKVDMYICNTCQHRSLKAKK